MKDFAAEVLATYAVLALAGLLGGLLRLVFGN